MDTPYAIIHLDETPSTQDIARRNFDGEPLLVVSPVQTAGRGRSGSNWETAPRAMAASVACRTTWSSGELSRIPLVAGLAALEAVPADLRLKWPNDVKKQDLKVGGILVEASGDVVVVGFGLNLWWVDAPPGYGAVWDADPGPESHRHLAGVWAGALLARLERRAESWGVEEYRQACDTIGRSIEWKPNGAGTVINISDQGGLVVETDQGVVELISGAVSELRDS